VPEAQARGLTACSPSLPDDRATGKELTALARELFPIGRSLTGDGVRETLRLVGERAPLDVTEVPSGTVVYDWVVPPEWNLREAWIADGDGRRLVDAADSPLHVVGYSVPVRATLTGAELQEHLHSLPERPDRVPYRTSYYEPAWGFCLADDVRATIDDRSSYDVLVDSRLDKDGSLTYGEHVVPGADPAAGELLVSTYVCHPSLANDNVSGIAVCAELARLLPAGQLRHDVRFLFGPAGLGALAWLARNEERLSRVAGGLVVACAGDRGGLHYKRSRRGDADVDRAAALVLAGRHGSELRDFEPWGTDERQFCSPGFDLPVGTLTRTPNGRYDEYHTSADDLSLLSPDSLADTLRAIAEILDVLDLNVRLERVEPRGEPQLSRHRLEGGMTAGLLQGTETDRRALFWLLNLADGRRTLLDVAERGGLPFEAVVEAAGRLLSHGLVREVTA
jgi:aminopeptidase-like protein